MTGNQVHKILKSDKKYQGLEIRVDTRRKQIDIYGVNQTENPKLAENGLKELGFDVANNGATQNWREKPQRTTDRSQWVRQSGPDKTPEWALR
jgi:hypothetical protein